MLSHHSLPSRYATYAKYCLHAFLGGVLTALARYGCSVRWVLAAFTTSYHQSRAEPKPASVFDAGSIIYALQFGPILYTINDGVI
ncbi:hypothetical protein BCV70DRAFT_37804 [Testicularia cyperi]|uniref:Uncharacterized protein n=1 Tax=Testicularia cyperi TaxID=1882483 RepID=A0A317XKE0_9BASI|nr:hypothetical protein BCV70DRAFT_37804 [Testicularia cyperi]